MWKLRQMPGARSILIPIERRLKEIRSLERSIGIEQARIDACKLEMRKVGGEFTVAYREFWRREIEHTEAIFGLQAQLAGKRLCYILTGKRWALRSLKRLLMNLAESCGNQILYFVLGSKAAVVVALLILSAWILAMIYQR